MRSNRKAARRARREFTTELKAEAVRLVAEGRAAGHRSVNGGVIQPEAATLHAA